MAISNFDAKKIINKYKAGTCTAEEKLLVELWYGELPEFNIDLDTELVETDLKGVWQSLKSDINPHKHFLFADFLIKAAAIFLGAMLLLGGSFYFLGKPKNAIVHYVKSQIKPGGNKATLTLADGKTIFLDKVTKGPLFSEKSIKITKTGDGQIEYSYNYAQKNANTNKGNHRISTPVGGQYQVTLPDGSNAWLNAASSITYPINFENKERIVAITGEVYFEIAKNKSKPFKVTVNDMTVKVLGTHFNIAAYQDDPIISTTLFEGAVEIKTAKDVMRLKPRQMAKWNKGEEKIKQMPADLEQALAWKNGYFAFNDENIKSIMLKLSRWYDFEVVYQGNIAALNFSAKISRRSNITEVLEIFQSTGTIKFKIKGRRIIITP
ncbi:transmembrane sensor [Pedobacter sp. CG_S7]|uniref:FecR family protein n=1 Tax=Pedobacter sp. CG_S7 TaxID=3143930 RepID=UPI00339591A5